MVMSCRYAKFEMQVHEVARARTCYERGLEALGEDANTVSTAHCYGPLGCCRQCPGAAASAQGLFALMLAVCLASSVPCLTVAWPDVCPG